MAPRDHPGWQPDTLRHYRQAYGLTLEEAGAKLRAVAEHRGLSVPGGNFQTIWRHERGEVYPSPHYRRAYCLLYHAGEADLGFRLPLPHEQSPETAASVPDVGDDDTVRRRDFLRAAVVGGAAVAMTPAIERVRSAVITYPPRPEAPTLSLGKAEMAAVEAHRLYQAAEYEAAAKLLPAVVRDVEALAETTDPPPPRERVRRVQTVAYVAVSKLAVKTGDGELALVSADRAARYAEHPALAGAAAYQVACALLRAGRLGDAERVALAAADGLARIRTDSRGDVASVLGALLLLAALIAARRGDRQDTGGRLADAARLADRLGRDDNRLWTGFGPTNVAIHEVSAAVELGDTARAFEAGEGLDTAALPAPLVGRRSQVHLDLAWASAHRDQDPLAVLHLLEAERVAPQVLRFNVAARNLLSYLLDREQRAATPGLRPLAARAGLLA